MRLVAAIVVLVGITAPGIRAGAGGASSDPVRVDDVIVVGNPTLRASLERIHSGSALWRAEVERAAATGRRIVVLTADQVVVADHEDGTDGGFDAGSLAEVSVIAGDGARIDAVLVAVNLRLIDEAHRQLGLPWSQRDADLDRILVHEVYGHALPYILAGNTSGRCADPAAGQRASEACAIQRENAVRAELGLGRRADSGLLSLALARGF